jgi:hypothetical protein
MIKYYLVLLGLSLLVYENQALSINDIISAVPSIGRFRSQIPVWNNCPGSFSVNNTIYDMRMFAFYLGSNSNSVTFIEYAKDTNLTEKILTMDSTNPLIQPLSFYINTPSVYLIISALQKY